MRRLLLCLAIGLVNCGPNNEEILKKIQEDPVNAFLVRPFEKPKLAFELEREDRLPRDVVVHSYDIRIEPFFDYVGFEYDKSLRNSFNGETKIVFSVFQPTTQIVLASSVYLRAVSLTLGRQRIKVLDYKTKAKSLLEVRTEKLAPNRNYTLNFKYSKYMGRPLFGGLFTATYRNPEGNFTSLLATNFDMIFARKAFPCFDDPWFKSVFHISLIHPKNASVYSNQQIAEQRYFDEQRLLTRFKPSPKMSTYLVAFAIGDFEEVRAYSRSGVLNRAISVRGGNPFHKNDSLTGAAVVDAMEGLLNVSYPLEKLGKICNFLKFVNNLSHSLMICRPFGQLRNAGGRVSWGLIIYGGFIFERLGKNIAELVLERRVISHATAHQWFGSLVAGDRWGLVFLHEAFATFFETKAPLDPGFTYLAEVAQVPLIRDAVERYSKARHPIVDDDGSTYSVGGALLTSVRHALGDSVFYKGLHIFVTENKYGSAGLDELIQSFIKAKGTDKLCGSLTVTEYLEDYFLRAGSPIVNVSLENTRYTIEQDSAANGGKTWNVPVIVLDIASNKEHLLWLLKDNSLCSPDNSKLDAQKAYIFNNEGKGFAVFNLDVRAAVKTLESVKFVELSVHNMQHLLHHVPTGTNHGDASDIAYRAIVEKKSKVPYFLLKHVDDEVSGKAQRKDVFQRKLEVWNILSDDFDYKPTVENRLLGQYFLYFAVRANVTSAVRETAKLFEQFTQDCAVGKDIVECPRIPPEYRSAVYDQGAKTEEGLKFLREYRKRIEAHPLEIWMTPEQNRLIPY
ncbi:unnamed protein product [Bursaphelenchus xylophilus]|uniref:(pine wood nematode) hypothetical protein n=1 Tax=Bursaphelenchus xylophilus TaxID=6326 RepID=A0A1I7RW09_BURXY|nr:unnamed protein product [Bursaphelenchus xylophilus]CAG9094982.1 unnamed protein product [Bursaphelenchus xylophilus]